MTLILITVLILLLLNPNISAICVLEASRAWFFKLVPVLYPNLIIIDFLANDYYLELLSYYIYKYFKKVFYIKYPKSCLILIISFICGAPASSKLIANALDNNEIDEAEADSLIFATSTLSLPYIIYILGLFNIPIAFYLALQVLYIIIVLWITNKKGDFINIKPKKIKKSYINALFTSITKNIDVLINILGVMIFFNILLTLVNFDSRFYSYFEILNGHNYILNLEIEKKLKDIIVISSLSFIGISMHLQIMLVYPKIKYLKFFLIKLLYCLCSILITFLL